MIGHKAQRRRIAGVRKAGSKLDPAFCASGLWGGDQLTMICDEHGALASAGFARTGPVVGGAWPVGRPALRVSAPNQVGADAP